MLSRRHDTIHPAAGLIARGILCAALGLSLASGQNPLPEDDAAPGSETGEALLEGDLLRDGSILKDVKLPRYDGERAHGGARRAGGRRSAFPGLRS